MRARREMTGVRTGTTALGVTCAAAIIGSLAFGYGPAVGAAAQQSRAAVQGPPPTGTGTLTVHVVANDSGAPIRDVRLSIFGAMAPATAPQRMGGPLPPAGSSPRDAGASPSRDGTAPPSRVQKEGRTDQAGVATFTSLPAGLYTVNVMPPAAYIRTQPSSPVPITDGGAGKTMIQLDRGGVIAGRVLDEYGEPVTGATISVFRKEKFGGAARTSSRGSSQPTNDLGQFRAWGLPEGDYVVSAMANEYSSVPGDTGVREGHLPTFYPGVSAFDGARAVTVKPGQETGGIEFSIVEGRLGAVSGRVTDSAGNSLADAGAMGAHVTLSPKTANPAFSGRGASVRPDGSFIIPSVPPGDYYLSAATGGTRSGGPPEGAYVPVTVNGDEATVTIQTNLGATIAGRVVLEGTAPAARAGAPGSESRQSAIRVGVHSASATGYSAAFAASQPAAVRPDGTFELSGIRGPIHITAQAGRAALKSVRRGGRDIGGQPLELLGTERLDDVVIVMTQETGRIDGVVNGEDGEPVAATSVLVFPDNPDRWSVASPFVRQFRTAGAGNRVGGLPTPGVSALGAQTVTPLAPGAFSATMLAAGRYAVVALPPGTPSTTPDKDSLTRWRDLAKVITVEAGQTATVQLTPIK